MKRRTLSILLIVAYALVSTIFGRIHHHESLNAGHPVCTACVWHLSAVSDVPISPSMPEPPETQAIETAPIVPVFSLPLPSSFHSRAPPAL